jgi:hypothetical protein
MKSADATPFWYRPTIGKGRLGDVSTQQLAKRASIGLVLNCVDDLIR